MGGHGVGQGRDGGMGRLLSQNQVEGWRRDGFLVLERFLDSETLASLRTAYDEVLAGQVVAAGDRMLGGITRQVMHPSHAHPVFDKNSAVSTGIELARELLGAKDVVRSFDMLIYKPPGHPYETPWHQDMAYAGRPFAPAGTPNPDDSIQYWVPLDDVDVENGCMQFAPGYHAQPLLEHQVAAGDAEDEGRLLALVDPGSQLDLSTVVVAEIPAGGVTLHSYGTPHYTGPNRSADRPRRSYIFNLVASGDRSRRAAG